jgi:Uma2 family endonuclease
MLRPTDHGRAMTLEEFNAARRQEGYRYELIDGRVYVAAVPSFSHWRLVRWLYQNLEGYAHQHPEVLNVVSFHSAVRVPARPLATQPEPDLAAYRDVPLNQPLDAVDWPDLNPILVVEVISEDDPAKDTRRNVALYQAVPSIREYWVLDPRPEPDQPRLIVYRRRGQRWQRPIEVAFGETYTTRLLPGFSLVVDPRR